jgi:hypothetical protein
LQSNKTKDLTNRYNKREQNIALFDYSCILITLLVFSGRGMVGFDRNAPRFGFFLIASAIDNNSVSTFSKTAAYGIKKYVQ